jgi:hypothetical protein
MAKCKRCDGTGWYAYDEIHSKPCEDCCTHPADKRYVQSDVHPKPGAWTCGMCGTELSAKPNVTKQNNETMEGMK